MRNVKWVAAAAGVVLLVAGCGSEGGSDKGGSASVTGGTGASGSGGGKLDAAAVTKEIEAAATGAGFAQDSSGDDIAPELKDCMITWTADAEKAADPVKSYGGTITALTGGGWKELRSNEMNGSVIKSLEKSGWTLQASNHAQGPLKMVMFVAADSGPECAAKIAADNEKARQSS
ncbi:hypothetical protein OG357_27815 [Streptomyces sp. NBC_01255]|uniref:hypothetical protein n=1 Tax=Streptomyces sp. NBC_01255 TaxID=2903798 RepID=UPI002E35FA7C|nr:hypothetical protein [Streptomyces sp. NBC_01255]